MNVVMPLTAVRILPTVNAPMNIDWASQHASIYERPDIKPDSIIDIRIPAHWLFMKILPTHVYIVGRLTFQDQLKLALEIEGRRQANLRPSNLFPHRSSLPFNPVLSEIAVG